jgi:hypothetical protein
MTNIETPPAATACLSTRPRSPALDQHRRAARGCVRSCANTNAERLTRRLFTMHRA